MSNTLLPPLTGLTSSIPATIDDAAKILLKGAIYEILATDYQCHCAGNRASKNSVAVIVREKARAVALTREIDSRLREIAGADGAIAMPEVLSGLTADQVQGVITYTTATLTLSRIDELVPDAEMGELETEALAGQGLVRDPEWIADINQFVDRASVHSIYSQSIEGLWVPESVSVRLDSIRPSVDNDGEVMAWVYTED